MCQWGRRFLTDAYNKQAKTKECLNHNIYIKIDDSVRICNDCIEKRITTILMDTPYMWISWNTRRSYYLEYSGSSIYDK